jgi:hypothetical protein
MVKRMNLIPGRERSYELSDAEVALREEKLRLTVEHYLPAFVKMVERAMTDASVTVVLMHQDAFAAGYDRDEYILLGMAVKYAGLFGVDITIGGKNCGTGENQSGT